MRALVAALLGLAVVTAPARAQTPAGAHNYDPQAEVTLTGIVVDYHESKSRNDHPGLHFILQLEPEPGSAPAPTAPTPEAATDPAAAAEAAAEPAEAGAEPAVAGGEPAEAGSESVALTGEASGEPLDATAASEPETVEVHACPVRLLSQLDFPIEKGDELTVTGSRPANGRIVIAREIKKGFVTLQIRDEKGVPIWTGLP